MWYKNVGKSFVRFVTIHAFGRQTDGRSERPGQYRALHYMQSHGKNRKHIALYHMQYGSADLL